MNFLWQKYTDEFPLAEIYWWISFGRNILMNFLCKYNIKSLVLH